MKLIDSDKSLLLAELMDCVDGPVLVEALRAA
jgi:hypothetical protein